VADNNAAMHPNDEIRKLAKLIDGIEIAMLTTRDAEGELHSRPMQTQQIEFNGDLYFFSNENTEKVADIRRDSRVNVVYASPKGNTYVSLAGAADIVKDRAKMEELWAPGLKVWFPQELETPGICLIRVRVSGAEYWDGPGNILTKAVGMARFAVSRDPSAMGDHGTVTVR
jgi:general stress protein 26